MRIRYSPLERLYLVGIAAAMLVFMVILVWHEFGTNPPPHVLIVCSLIELPFIWLAVKAFYFELRADDEEIFHRENGTRRIPLERVEKIRVAFEDLHLPDLGMNQKLTKIEIFGHDQRIKVTWRKSKLAPLLEFLEQ